MNESRFLFAASQTSDAFLRDIGVDAAYVAAGFSYYTVETHIRHLAEARQGDPLAGALQVLAADDRRLHVFITITRGDALLATVEQMLLHVDRTAGRAGPVPAPLRARLAQVAADHAALPRPAGAGRHIGQPRA